MTQKPETLIYEARCANKRIRIYHRYFNDRHEYAVTITGGGWRVGTLFSDGSAGDRLRFAIAEVRSRHPRAWWSTYVSRFGEFGTLGDAPSTHPNITHPRFR